MRRTKKGYGKTHGDWLRESRQSIPTFSVCMIEKCDLASFAIYRSEETASVFITFVVNVYAMKPRRLLFSILSSLLVLTFIATAIPTGAQRTPRPPSQ